LVNFESFFLSLGATFLELLPFYYRLLDGLYEVELDRFYIDDATYIGGYY
jgi:hypothetical protein